MNDSRRSGTAIMETVNDTFQNLPDNKAIVSDSKKDDQPQPLVSAAKSWYHRFQTHQTVQKFHSYAELRTVPYIQENSEESDQSESSDSENADQLRQMVYQYTAEQVKSMYEQTKPMNFSIGVLTRSNEAACSIAELIKKQGLECSLEGKSPLLDSSSVVLILALLGWIDHPGNSQAAYQVCHSPLVHFLGWDNQPLFDNNGLPAIPANSNEKLQRLRLDIMNKGYGAVIEQWANYLSAQSSDRNRRRLDSLIEMAYAYNEKITCRTDDFIAYIQSHAVQDLINCRIRVMTYHQSKGLEFDIVILPELNKALFNTNDEIVVSGRPSPTEPWNQIIRSVKQEYRYLLPAAQQNLFVQRDERLMQEALCNLYVALTRAARGLYMYLTPPKQNGKSANAKQYADVLMGSLAPGSKLAEDTIYYQKGDSNWIENTFTEFQNKETAGKKADKTTSPNAPENIILSSKCEFHSDASKRNYFVPITASGWKLEEGESTQFIELISVNQDSGVLESLSPSHRGSLFHKWLEDVRWLKDYQFDASHLIELGISLGFQSAEFENYIPLFKQLLQRQELQSILNPPDNDWSVYREKAVGAHIPQKGKPHTFWLLNGAIDRLMLCQSEGIISQAVILDYKTVPAGFNASALKKKYSGQMDAYRQMVCQTYHLPVEKVKNQLLVIEV